MNDRKASCIELILRALRSSNRGSFHVSPNTKNLVYRALDVLVAWRHSSSFTEEERLVLQWAESVTSLSRGTKKIKEELRRSYTDKQIVDLTACIGIMNALNRIEISLED